jgi:hypothetical protein
MSIVPPDSMIIRRGFARTVYHRKIITTKDGKIIEAK